jgi:transposase
MEHGSNANLLFKWRKQYRHGMSEKTCIKQPTLLPVTIVKPAPASSKAEAQAPASVPGPASPAARGVIDIRLGSVLVHVDGMVDPATPCAPRCRGCRGCRGCRVHVHDGPAGGYAHLDCRWRKGPARQALPAHLPHEDHVSDTTKAINYMPMWIR